MKGIRNFLSKKPNSLDSKLLLDYPWTLETNTLARPIPSFWDTIRSKHLLNMGYSRARKLFKDEAYPFPYQFEADASKIITNCLKLLSSEQGAIPAKLQEFMVDGMVNRYKAGTDQLIETDKAPSYVFHSSPNIRINAMHFTYGPFPPPENYVSQKWLDFMTIMLPKDEAIFESHPRQNELMKNAENEGCYLRIDTTAEFDIEFVISNSQGLPFLRDRRSFLDVSFTSPHFNPWDIIFDLQSDGTWKLNWDWKIVNIDTKYV
jgi:hypothetical protein